MKVENLLKVCANLPSIEKVRKNRNSWIDRIKEPFEEALEGNVRAGIIKSWKYTHEKGIDLTDEEAQNITDYDKFRKLYITYEIGIEADNEQRFIRQEEKKKRNAQKKKKATAKRGS